MLRGTLICKIVHCCVWHASSMSSAMCQNRAVIGMMYVACIRTIPAQFWQPPAVAVIHVLLPSMSALSKFAFRWTDLLQWCVSWALFQYPIRRLIVRSREVSKPRDWWLKLSHRFEIWQAPRQLIWITWTPVSTVPRKAVNGVSD